MRIILTLFLTIFFTATNSFAQRNFSNTKIIVTPVGNSLYMLEGEGGNIAFSTGDDGILMIDDQFAELNERILAAIKKIDERKIEFLLNTHWHGDHTGGNELIHHQGAHIVAHENVRKRLSARQVRKSTGRVNEARPKEALPVLTYDNGVTFHFNAQTINVVHFGPGHTDGDSIVFFEDANVIHMGDQMFSGRFPFIDLDSGGNVDGYISTIETVLPRIDEQTKIIPGHGPLSTKGDVVKFLKMLKYSRNTVKKALEEGVSKEDISKLNFSEDYTAWGSGFINKERWLGILYTFYSGEK